MELRLLSFGEACDLGPDPAAEISQALKQLAKHSGELLPRAALIHDNGQDFIQFYSTKAPGSGKLKGKILCHVQFCMHSGPGSKPEHYCSDAVKFDQVIELFQLFAQKKQDWDKGVSWEPYRDKGKALGKVLGQCIGLPLILGGILWVLTGLPDGLLGGGCMAGSGLMILLAGIFQKTMYGKPWEFAPDGGGSCSGGCGSGCGGSGGSGCGGGDGGGGCGGGGE